MLNHFKKISAALLCAAALTAVLPGIPAWSAGTACAEELTLIGEGGGFVDAAAAESLAQASEAQLSLMKEYYDQGVRVFDTARVLRPEDRAQLQTALEEYTVRSGLDAVIVTTEGTGGRGIEDYADLLYYESGAGLGDTYDGSLLIMDMGGRNLYIYAQGKAARYLTDAAQEKLLDDYLAAGFEGDNYAPGFAAYVTGLNRLYEAGIAKDQYNYNSETGEKDYAYRQHSLSIFEILIAAVIAFLAGWLPVASIKKKYAMKTEKKMAENFRLAYRADARFGFSSDDGGDQLVDRFVTTARIPRNNSPVNRSGPGGSFGGGRTTMSSGRGGRMHTGSGRKF